MRFPDWETLPYDAFSPHQDITSERLACLQQLRNDPDGVLIVPAATLVQKIAPTTFLDGACFDLKRGQLFKTEEQRLRLEAAGYQATDTVTERGQYAIRGAVMDIFPMGADLPVRIDLFDDEIDTLRTFDPETQLSVDQINELIILPGKEFPFDDTAVAGSATNGITPSMSMYDAAAFTKTSRAISHPMELSITYHSSSTKWPLCSTTCPPAHCSFSKKACCNGS